MAEFVYSVASSLDGFIADQNHSLDWLLQFGDPPPEQWEEFMAGVGAVVMGANTYRWILDNVPEPDWPYDLPTFVFTSHPVSRARSPHIRLASGSIAPHVPELLESAQGRNVWIVGGGGLAAQFYQAGLLHRVIITLAPVTLGRGAPLFPCEIHPPLVFSQPAPMGPHLIQITCTVPQSGIGAVEKELLIH